jgi:hypothetical protein
MTKKKLHCSFCQKSEDDAKVTIAGPSPRVAACDECVAAMVEIIAEWDGEWRDAQILTLCQLRSDAEILKLWNLSHGG